MPSNDSFKALRQQAIECADHYQEKLENLKSKGGTAWERELAQAKLDAAEQIRNLLTDKSKTPEECLKKAITYIGTDNKVGGEGKAWSLVAKGSGMTDLVKTEGEKLIRGIVSLKEDVNVNYVIDDLKSLANDHKKDKLANMQSQVEVSTSSLSSGSRFYNSESDLGESLYSSESSRPGPTYSAVSPHERDTTTKPQPESPQEPSDANRSNPSAIDLPQPLKQHNVSTLNLSPSSDLEATQENRIKPK